MAVYELKPESERIAYDNPDQNIPESERTPEWYTQNIRYICTFYDRWVRNAFVLEQINDPNTNSATDQTLSSPVQYMLRMMMYYLGRQPNLDYANLTPDVTSSNLMPDWIRGQKIFTIINFMKDIMLQMLQNVDFEVKAMSEDAVSDRKVLQDKLMVQYELKEIFKQLEEEGVKVNSAGGQDFEFPEDVEFYLEKGYKDMDSEITTSIATHIWLFNAAMSKFLNAFVHINTAGQCGIEHYVSNGNYHMDVHLPHQLITDARNDDDYGRRSRFVGTIKYLTPTEIFVKYPEFDSKQRTDIRNMASDSTGENPYNTMQNLVWWNYTGAQQKGTVACVTGYWLTMHDLGKEKYTNKFGIETIKKTDKEKGDYIIEDVGGATLIGNRYVVGYGYVDNVAEDYYNKSKPKLPIMVFKPNMLLGESRSIASRIHELQDERDAYKFKIREMIGNSVGKAYVVKGWMFGNGVNTKELFKDLKSMRVHVATHAGEIDPAMAGERAIEAVDMTLDPNIVGLGAVIAAIDSEMMEIGKVSYTAMGEPQKYMGLGVMQGAMQNSSGSAYIYTGFMDFIQMNMQYGVDICKYLYAEDETDYPQAIIGKRGVEYLKVAKRIKYSNPLVYLTVNDFIEEKQRERMLGIAQAAAQNQEIGFLDYIHVETSKTFTQLKDRLEYGVKKQDKQHEKEKAMENQLNILSEQNAQLNQQMLEITKQMGARNLQTDQIAADQVSQAAEIANNTKSSNSPAVAA